MVTGLGQLAPQRPPERTATLCLPSEGSPPATRQQVVSGGRPLTAAFSGAAGAVRDVSALLGAAAARPVSQPEQRLPPSPASSRLGASGGAAGAHLTCQQLTLAVLDTWGDSHFVGLAGLQLLGPDGQPLPLSADRVAADPPDLNVFPGHSGAAPWLGPQTPNDLQSTHCWASVFAGRECAMWMCHGLAAVRGRVARG